MEEKMTNGSDKSINRRSFIGKVSASALIGSTGLSTTAVASKEERIRIEKKEVSVSNKETRKNIQSDLVERLVENLKNAKIMVSKAKKHKIVVGEKEIGYTITVPTGVGELKLIFEQGTLVQANITLKRDRLHRSIEAKIESVRDWPENTKGHLRSVKNSEEVTFFRTISERENEKIRSLVKVQRDRASIVANYALPNTKKGKAENTYRVLQKKQYYILNNSASKVVETGEVLEKNNFTVLDDCTDKAALCLLDIGMALPHCGAASMACGITGPVTAACVVAVLGICGPDVALVTISGNCTYVANNCL